MFPPSCWPNPCIHHRQTQRHDHSPSTTCLLGSHAKLDGSTAIEGHRTRPDGSDLKWKQIGVNEITDSRELPFFIQWLTADHPSQDGKAVAAIEKITIADTDHLSDYWFKTEIFGGLNGADVEFVDPSANDGEYGIVAVYLNKLSGSVVLD